MRSIAAIFIVAVFIGGCDTLYPLKAVRYQDAFTVSNLYCRDPLVWRTRQDNSGKDQVVCESIGNYQLMYSQYAREKKVEIKPFPMFLGVSKVSQVTCRSPADWVYQYYPPNEKIPAVICQLPDGSSLMYGYWYGWYPWYGGYYRYPVY